MTQGIQWQVSGKDTKGGDFREWGEDYCAWQLLGQFHGESVIFAKDLK